MFRSLLGIPRSIEFTNPFERYAMDYELVAYMMEFLPLEQVARARTVSRLFNVAGGHNVLWKNKRRLH